LAGSFVFVVAHLGKGNNVLCLRAFLTLDNIKLYTLAFIQVAVAFSYDGVVVDENVPASIALDEAVAFRAIEPLNYTLFTVGHDLELLSSKVIAGYAGVLNQRWNFYSELLF